MNILEEFDIYFICIYLSNGMGKWKQIVFILLAPSTGYYYTNGKIHTDRVKSLPDF